MPHRRCRCCNQCCPNGSAAEVTFTMTGMDALIPGGTHFDGWVYVLGSLGGASWHAVPYPTALYYFSSGWASLGFLTLSVQCEPVQDSSPIFRWTASAYFENGFGEPGSPVTVEATGTIPQPADCNSFIIAGSNGGVSVSIKSVP